MQLRPIALAIVCAACALAQEQTRTFTFAHTQDPRHMQEVLNTVRAVAEVQHAVLDPAQRSLAVGGTPDQLSFITWLFTDLDRPASRPQNLVVRDNTFSDPRSPAVKIFYPARFTTAQQVQDVVNAVRSIAEVQRVVALNGAGAIVARGNPEQIALAEWIVAELDRSMAGKRPAGIREYTYPDSDLQVVERRTTAVRIYYPASVSTPQDMQETVNGLRSFADVQRVVSFVTSGAIIARSNTEQATMMDWLVKELDAGASASGSHDYRWSAGTVRSAWLPKAADLAGTVAKVRQMTGMQRVVGLQRQRAIVMRGTPDQLAAAEPLLR
jgi:hypothetical protein